MIVFYFLLNHFHTANIIPSTLSVTTSFLAVYLTFRRCPAFALAYAANDFIDYSTPGAYFITVCTANREKIFWNCVGADIIRPKNVPLSTAGKIVEQGILQIAEHYKQVVVDKYCIMPDHIHMILRIESDIDGRMISAPTASTIIGSMKRWVSKQIGRPIWQKSFYDHGIRNQQDYDEIWEYIENNPLKYALNRTP